MCGFWKSFPAWMARLNDHLSAVSSRLISPFDTPAIVRRCSATWRTVPSLAVNVYAFRVRRATRLGVGLAQSPRVRGQRQPSSGATYLRMLSSTWAL